MNRHSDRVQAERPLRHELRFWLWLCGAIALTDGLVWLTLPHKVMSPAYDWVRIIAPPEFWGIAFLACAALMLVGAWSHEPVPVRAGLVLHTALCWAFGVSILGTAIENSAAGLTGTTKWAAFAVVSATSLARTINDPCFEADC